MPDGLSGEDVARTLGGKSEDVVGLWRVLGLPLPAAGFGEDDVALLRLLLDLTQDIGGPRADAQALARPVGHHAGRLATWQVLGLVEGLTENLPPEQAAAAARELADRHLPALEALLVRVWRRHIAAVLDWRSGRAGEEAFDLELSVGFSDMVDYTTLTAGLEGRALAALVRAFEGLCVSVIAAHGGRLVKTLGDEVLYVADEPEAAVRIGLALQEHASGNGLLPDLRVGVATGTVTAVLGDVYGVTVNRASRLTRAAQPGQVLLDEPTAARTRHVAHLTVRPRGPLALPGLGEVLSWRASR